MEISQPQTDNGPHCLHSTAPVQPGAVAISTDTPHPHNSQMQHTRTDCAAIGPAV